MVFIHIFPPTGTLTLITGRASFGLGALGGLGINWFIFETDDVNCNDVVLDKTFCKALFSDCFVDVMERAWSAG